MELFAKIVNSFLAVNYFRKNSNLDIWLRSDLSFLL